MSSVEPKRRYRVVEIKVRMVYDRQRADRAVQAVGVTIHCYPAPSHQRYDPLAGTIPQWQAT